MPRQSRQLTVMVVGEHAEPVRRVQLPRRLLLQGGAVLGAVGLAVALSFGHYLSLLPEAAENRALRAENAELRKLMGQVKDRLSAIAATVERVERYDQKLRTAVTGDRDPERGLAIGPVDAPGEPHRGPAPAAQENLVALPGRLASLQGEAARQEQSLRELQEYFDDRQSLLATTPSIWPTRGWVTSDFGVRLDPVAGERRMHDGLDVASPHGQLVVAPSDGTVVFKGPAGGYGNVLVLDHGYGVKTRYGHLSQVLVELGERVRRGARIATVGNTGKSTAPHLHYEVRVNGVAENPRKFILE